MKSRCVIRVEFPDEESLGAAYEALSHEGSVGSRSSARVSKEGKSLAVEIEASDVVAMRAAANACMRALQAFEGIENTK